MRVVIHLEVDDKYDKFLDWLLDELRGYLAIKSVEAQIDQDD